MKRMILILSILGLVLISSTGNAAWLLDETVDPLTDEKKIRALSSYTSGVHELAAVVRCQGGDLEVYFEFGRFLNSEDAPVRFRVDKFPLVEDSWATSADGTAVFPLNSNEIARILMNGKHFIIEARDFRGQPYRASFDLSGAKEKIAKVLRQCGVSLAGLCKEAEGLRNEIANELERWGPKNIFVNKRILAALGVYTGPLDKKIEPGFALAVQKFYDDFLGMCKSGEISSVMCMANPPVTAVIYDRAPENLKKEAGSLHLGD